MKITRVGVDLAKNVFQLHGVDRPDKLVWKRNLSRKNWLKILLKETDHGCEIGIEACAGAHHWARILMSKGYEVKIIAPQFVKPYVKSNKNGANDAEAICEAMSRPNMRFVEVKTTEQQDMQAMHRVLDELKSHRTAKGNQIRGLVAEYGLVAPKQLYALPQAIPDWLEDGENGLSSNFRQLLQGLREDLVRLDERIAQVNEAIEQIARTHPVAQRLQQLRGVGPLVSTAMIASVGTGRQFSRGRQMAASLGVTPKQFSSGGKERLQGISKRGDAYLRRLLIHGARSVITHAKNKDDRYSRWMTGLAKRSHWQTATDSRNLEFAMPYFSTQSTNQEINS